jgi:hypothetical protein
MRLQEMSRKVLLLRNVQLVITPLWLHMVRSDLRIPVAIVLMQCTHLEGPAAQRVAVRYREMLVNAQLLTLRNMTSDQQCQVIAKQ